MFDKISKIIEKVSGAVVKFIYKLISFDFGSDDTEYKKG